MLTKQIITLCNGQLCEPTISMFDLGFMRGYAVFEYLRTYSGKPFYLGEHLERLERSARCVGLDLPMPLEALASDVLKGIEIGGFAESGVKVIVTGGESSDQFHYEGKSRCYIMVYPHMPYPKTTYERGVSLLLHEHERPFPECKTLFYLPAIEAMRRVSREGYDDALFVNREQNILETGTANFFAVKDGVLLTPSDGVLEGITRKVVLSLCDCELRPICVSEIEDFEGAFLTASNKEVMPVKKINHLHIPFSDKVQHVMSIFGDYIENI